MNCEDCEDRSDIIAMEKDKFENKLRMVAAVILSIVERYQRCGDISIRYSLLVDKLELVFDLFPVTLALLVDNKPFEVDDDIIDGLCSSVDLLRKEFSNLSAWIHQTSKYNSYTTVSPCKIEKPVIT